jgi:hypothetical protein
MKIIFLFISLISLGATGQSYTTKDIAAMEMTAHQRIMQGDESSFASGNFDEK